MKSTCEESQADGHALMASTQITMATFRCTQTETHTRERQTVHKDTHGWPHGCVYTKSAQKWQTAGNGHRPHHSTAYSQSPGHPGSLCRASSESWCINLKCPLWTSVVQILLFAMTEQANFCWQNFSPKHKLYYIKLYFKFEYINNIKIIYISGIGIGKNKIIVYNQRTI